MIDTAAIARMIKELTDYMSNPAYKELNELMGRMRWEKYKAYRDVGFSEQQALELCMKDFV